MAKKTEGKVPAYALDDVSSRFIINARPEEVRELTRFFFTVETAYWFYLDFHCVENPSLRQVTMKEFSLELFKHVPSLREYLSNFDKHFDSWKAHKRTIGTYGAILIDETAKNVLLVQSYGNKNTWGFPKGKINPNEEPVECAVREVLEETSFDIRPHIDPYEYLEKNFNDQLNRLYLIPDISLNTVFIPKTRREIRDIIWFPLEMLLSSKTPDLSLQETVGGNLNLYTVLPYLRPIQRWINERQSKGNTNRQKKRSRHQYQDFGQLKKGGRNTPKNVVNERKNSVRYSKDILGNQEMQVKQGKRGMTVGECLFGKSGHREMPMHTFQAPEVDTGSFFSKTLFDFKLDVEGILALLPTAK